ncbi:MAG: hypothetical protein HKN35_11915 [Woeseia sp.]|nr:hypothetical protein [Woeseia sp.]MBT8096929.1 hypothetical protein [Woeseia sp.]NNE61595.1 hypothetical protein [Woeseia sp.]NNL55484.1 hypothetical protein [Woeseia sp.]
MFRVVRITLLLLLLIFVSGTTWLAQARSTDWNNSLWVKIYPINGDGSAASRRYIENLDVALFAEIESFLAREVSRYGVSLERPVRIELGEIIDQQPPDVPLANSRLSIMAWSLKMRWWAHRAASPQDSPAPDVRIFVRYFEAREGARLENSVGLQKGMVGLVNAYTGRRQIGSNNVVIAHEFLHTLGATDKYDPASGLPRYPDGFAEPELLPLFPQRFAELMGGRIAVADQQAIVPSSLEYVLIGPDTAAEIRLVR